MGNEIPEQLAMFLRSVLLGGVLGLTYDLLRPLRKLGGPLWGGVLDALMSATAVSSLFFFIMAGDGELRLFILLGALMGCVLFFCLLSAPLRPLWDFWLKLALIPLRTVEIFFKKLYQFCKKVFSFLQSWFTIMSTWRPAGAAQGRGDTMSASRKQKAAGKKRPSGKLTGVILLVLLLGVGIQLYHMRGQLQEARAEEAVYAQRLAELQARNAQLAEDIANSSDPELMEDIAREELGMVAPGEKVFRYGS